MTRMLRFSTAALGTLTLLAAVPALAQHGPPTGAGSGPPAGAGSGMPSGFPGGGASGNHGGSNWGNSGMPDGTGRPAISSSTSTRSLENNPHLASSLGNALARSGVEIPSTGLQGACEGFGNLGKCVAALHVAHRLGLPGGFDALKAEMTAGDELSLGDAITRLMPEADAKSEAKAAKRAARADLAVAENGMGN